MADSAVKMNTQSGLELPDVDDHPNGIKSAVLDRIDRLVAGSLTVDRYQDEIAALFDHTKIASELQPWLTRALAERKDQTLYRRTTPSTRVSLQLLYLDPREVHPPHAHHNLISSQMVLHGRVHAREYDRVARLDDDTILLRPLTDGWRAPGERIQATEVSKNAHWFAADENAAVMLNFYILGFQEWTFDPPGTRPRGRRLLDPTRGQQRDGLVVAAEIPLEAGYAKFGNRPLAEFPMPL